MGTRFRAGTAASTYVVEGYWPSTRANAFEAATDRLNARLAALRADGIPIRAIAATLLPDDEAAFWVVDAPSPEVVERACATAGLRIDRIVGALDLRASRAVGPGRWSASRGDLASLEAASAAGSGGNDVD